VRNFDWLPFTPPLVTSSVLQTLLLKPTKNAGGFIWTK
jgi:hypothetical protein